MVVTNGARVVTGIHLHPIKSCHRIEVDEATVGPYGLVGDREWQVVGDGEFRTQRHHRKLATVHPTPIPRGLRIEVDGLPELEVARPDAVDSEATTFTGPVKVADAGDEAAAWFEKLLGVPARLVAIAPGYSRPLPRALDLFGQEVALSDACPLLVATEASHRFLSERAAEPFGIERFRPNVIVGGCDPWEEDTWRAFTIGAASLRGVLPWPRCTMPQIDQETGERHTEPAVVMKRYRWCTEAPGTSPTVSRMLCGNGLFGIACSIHPDGAVIKAGDQVTVAETGEPVLPPPPDE